MAKRGRTDAVDLCHLLRLGTEKDGTGAVAKEFASLVLFGLPGFHDLDWALDHLREKIQDGLALGLVAETEEKKGGIFI
jgi:hypothetical protein